MNWTYEKCKEEAAKYETRSEFSKGNCSAYNASRSNGWLDDFFVKKKRNYKTCREEAKKKWFHDARHDKGSQWTEEMCREESKKYKTRTEFMKGSPTAYNQSLKNKWIREFDWLKRPESHLKKWTYETCKEEARKYTRRVDFMKGSSGAYRIAYKNEWIKDYDWFKRPEPHNKGKIKWTYDKCKAAFEAAWQNGWIEEWLEEKRSNFGIEIKK